MSFFSELKKFAHPYDDEEEDIEEMLPYKNKNQMEDYDLTQDMPKRNKVVNIHTTTQLQVVLVKPEKFENASEIADHLREKRKRSLLNA